MNAKILTSVVPGVVVLAIAIGGSLSTNSASAAGYALIEQSGSGMGNAFAGATTSAEDASTVYFNPAGMSYLQHRHISAALHYLRTEADFTDKGSTAATGGPLPGAAADIQVSSLIPNFYYVQPLQNDLTFGLGINVPFGLETNYDDDWLGRYHGVHSKIMSININPSVAWRSSDKKLSLGAGLSAQYIKVNLTSVVDFGAICLAQLPADTCRALGASPQALDGFADLETDSWGWGFNLGLIYEITPSTRVGFSYRSKVKHTAEGTADFKVPGEMAFISDSNNFVDTDITAKTDLPETLSLGFYHAYNDKLAVMVDWTRTRWTRFAELRIDYDSAQPDSVTTENWKDNNRFAIGVNYQLNTALLLRGGLALDKTAIPDRYHRTPRIPANDRRWLTVGFGYQVDKQISVDFGYAHLFVKKATTENTFESSVPTVNHTVKGDYSGSVDILSAQLNWVF